jgi:hypothetical protein
MQLISLHYTSPHPVLLLPTPFLTPYFTSPRPAVAHSIPYTLLHLTPSCCCPSPPTLSASSCVTQVLSPTTAASVDLGALALLDLPTLVACLLAILRKEFGWLARSFPEAFAVRVVMSMSRAIAVWCYNLTPASFPRFSSHAGHDMHA